VTTPPRPTLLRCKLARERDPECRRPIATPLAGDASIRPPFAAMAVERQRWIARAEQPRAKDLPSRRLLPQDNEGEGSPPRSSYSSTPVFVVESSSGGLDSPTVLMIRPRPSFRHRPAKGNAFPKAGVPSTARNPVTRGSLLDAAGQRPSITPPPDFRRDGIATGSLGAFVFHTRAPDSDEASIRVWLGGPWPGVVPGIARYLPQRP